MPAVRRPHETAQQFRAIFGTDAVRVGTALEHGFTRGALRAAVHRGLLAAVRHGVIAAQDDATGGGVSAHDVPGPQDPPHLSAARAALSGLSSRALLSHRSAALVHRLSSPDPGAPDLVSVIVPGAVAFTGAGVAVRGSGVPAADRCVVDGLPCTSLARTAVDLARGRRLPSALIPLDSAARLMVAESTGAHGNALRRAVRRADLRALALGQLQAALEGCYGWPGTLAVRRALPFVNPASESPLESRSRGWFLEAGLGPLDPGSPVVCGSTTYWADFCSAERRVVGEADGMAKYGASGEAVRSALARERARERALVAAGWRVVRWTTGEPRAAVVARMSAALTRP